MNVKYLNMLNTDQKKSRHIFLVYIFQNTRQKKYGVLWRVKTDNRVIRAAI